LPKDSADQSWRANLQQTRQQFAACRGTVVLPKYRITQPPTLRRKRLSKNAGLMMPTVVIPRTAFPRDGYIHGSQKAADAVMASKGSRMP
jgi:hypothetical protein